MTFDQFIFGSFEGIDGGHQVVAHSPGITPQVIKDLNQLQSRYIGDYQGRSPETIHYLWAPLKEGGKVFAGFNFLGEDSHGRQGIIRMHGFIVSETQARDLKHNPFHLRGLIDLDDLEDRAVNSLESLSVEVNLSSEFEASSMEDKEVLNFLIGKVIAEEETVFPFLGRAEKSILEQLFDLLTPQERRGTTFVTYSNFTNKLTLTGTSEFSTSVTSSYQGNDFVTNRTPKPSIRTQPTIRTVTNSSGQRRIETSRVLEEPTRKKPGIGMGFLVFAIIGLLGLLVFVLNYNSKPSDAKGLAVGIKDSIEASNKPVTDSLIPESTTSTVKDRQYINQKASPVKTVYLRREPTEDFPPVIKLEVNDIIYCEYCLTKLDTVRNGCTSKDTINAGNWCRVEVIKTKKKGWVWKPCITIQG